MKWLLTEAFQNHKTLDKEDIELVKKFVHTEFVTEDEYFAMIAKEDEKKKKPDKPHPKEKHIPRGC